VHVVSTLNERLGSHVSLEPRLWPFNCLDDEDSFDLALAEGIKADMVLIAVGETFQPRDSFKQWLKLCVDRKRGAGSAIVLMQEGQPVDSLELAGAQFIRRTALDAGLDFISSQCVQSESAGEGKAARFSTHGQGETASRAAPSNLVSPGRDSNILYVEDDPLQRRLCAMLLVRAGYEVTAAANAFEAWEELNSATFDLLVTDNEMQQSTGLDLVVKARAAGLALPIIIASGSASLLEKPEYDWLKLSARLQKPFDANRLMQALERGMKQHRG